MKCQNIQDTLGIPLAAVVIGGLKRDVQYCFPVTFYYFRSLFYQSLCLFRCSLEVFTFKALSKIVTDDILFLLFFRENMTLRFM